MTPSPFLSIAANRIVRWFCASAVPAMAAPKMSANAARRATVVLMNSISPSAAEDCHMRTRETVETAPPAQAAAGWCQAVNRERYAADYAGPGCQAVNRERLRFHAVHDSLPDTTPRQRGCRDGRAGPRPLKVEAAEAAIDVQDLAHEMKPGAAPRCHGRGIDLAQVDAAGRGLREVVAA